MDATATRHRATLLASRASSYASSSGASSDNDSAGSSATYFSSLSLANQSMQQASAPYSSSAVTAQFAARAYQNPSGMSSSTQASNNGCYRSVEEPTVHEDYDGLELHHSVSEMTQVSYYDYSYDPEEHSGEMGSIL